MVSDVLINAEGEVQVTNGDFDIGQSDQQHAFLLLATEKGEWRHQPLLGVGLSKYINDESPDVLMKQEIRVQLEADGANIARLNVKYAKIELEVSYG